MKEVVPRRQFRHAIDTLFQHDGGSVLGENIFHDEPYAFLQLP